MQEFITRATAALGISETLARHATGALLDLVSKSASATDVQQLIAKLPGAAELLAAINPPPPPPPSGVFGALGNIMSSATSALGALGGPAAFFEFVSKTGMTPPQSGQFAKMFLDFARQHAGDALVDKIVDAIPGARAFIR